MLVQFFVPPRPFISILTVGGYFVVCQGQVEIQSVIVYLNVGVDTVINVKCCLCVSPSVTVSAQKYVGGKK